MTGANSNQQLSDKVVRYLSAPSTYDDDSPSIQICETHLSWVFLSQKTALKLKKPVRFEFVDYSTLESREKGCRAELHLNRRWSKDVYLDVVPITRDARGQLALSGKGYPIDWVVKMRRLSDECRLNFLLTDALQKDPVLPLRHGIAAGENASGGSITAQRSKIRDERFSRASERDLADWLVNRYLDLPPLEIQPASYVDRIFAHEQANALDLGEHVKKEEYQLLLRTHGALLLFLFTHRADFESRVRSGRIVDGHGDLRPEHIYLESTPQITPQIIDGIEFSADLRTVDILDELCFLAMECEQLGATRLATTVLRTYQQRFGDIVSDSLVHFYKAYRAVVRAKVSALRSAQLAEEARRSFLRERCNYLHRADHE
ncbi:MAG: hypothetical protein ACR2NU_08660, partial [Aeoliella sp.]